MASWKSLVVKPRPTPQLLPVYKPEALSVYSSGRFGWKVWRFWRILASPESPRGPPPPPPQTRSWDRKRMGKKPPRAWHMGRWQLTILGEPASLCSLKPNRHPTAWYKRKVILTPRTILWHGLSCCFLLLIQCRVGCFQINPLNMRSWECLISKTPHHQQLFSWLRYKAYCKSLKKKSERNVFP